MNNYNSYIQHIKGDTPILFHPLRLETRFITIDKNSNGGNVGNDANRLIGTTGKLTDSVVEGRSGIKVRNFAPLIRQEKELAEKIQGVNSKDLNERDTWNLSVLKANVHRLVDQVKPQLYQEVILAQKRQKQLSKHLKELAAWGQEKKTRSKKSLEKQIKKELALEAESALFILTNKKKNKDVDELLKDQKKLINYLANMVTLLNIQPVIQKSDREWIAERVLQLTEATMAWMKWSSACIQREKKERQTLESTLDGMLTFHETISSSQLQKNNNKAYLEIWEWMEQLRGQLVTVERLTTGHDWLALSRTLEQVQMTLKKTIAVFSKLSKKPDYLWQELASLLGLIHFNKINFDTSGDISLAKIEEERSHAVIIGKQLKEAVNAEKDEQQRQWTEEEREEITTWLFAVNDLLSGDDWMELNSQSDFLSLLGKLNAYYHQLLPALFQYQKMDPKDIDYLMGLTKTTIVLQKGWERKSRKYVNALKTAKTEADSIWDSLERTIRRFSRNKLNARILQGRNGLWYEVYGFKTIFSLEKLKEGFPVNQMEKEFKFIKQKTEFVNQRAKKVSFLSKGLKLQLANVAGGVSTYVEQALSLAECYSAGIKDNIIYLTQIAELFADAKQIEVDNRYTASFDRVERLIGYYVTDIEHHVKELKNDPANINSAYKKTNTIIQLLYQILQLIENIGRTSQSDYRRYKKMIDKAIRSCQQSISVLKPETEKWRRTAKKWNQISKGILSQSKILSSYYNGRSQEDNLAAIWEGNTRNSLMADAITLKKELPDFQIADIQSLGELYKGYLKRIRRLKKVPLNLRYFIYHTNSKVKETLNLLQEEKDEQLTELRQLQMGIGRAFRSLNKLKNWKEDGRVKAMKFDAKEKVYQQVNALSNIVRRQEFSLERREWKRERAQFEFRVNELLGVFKGTKKINKKDAVLLKSTLSGAREKVAAQQSVIMTKLYQMQREHATLSRSVKNIQTDLPELSNHLSPMKSGGTFDVKGPVGKGPVSNQPLRVKAQGGDGNDDHSQELWVRVFPDPFAINNHDPLMTDREQKDAMDYWKAIWRMDETQDNERLGHWRALCEDHGAARAAFIVHEMKPQNLVNPAPSAEPAFSMPTTGDGSKRPESEVMPTQLVFELSGSGGVYERKVHDKFIPNPLPVSIDLQNQDAAVQTNDGTLILDDDLKWLTNFTEAEKIGMAIKIPLADSWFTGAAPVFEKLIVGGVKHSNIDNTNYTAYTGATSKVLLEELLTAHHYTDGGMSFLDPGTPTNNTSTRSSGYAHFDSPDATYDVETKSPLFEEKNPQELKADGQVLAEALGVDKEVFHHISNAGNFTRRNSGLINKALWPATFGYFIEHVLAFYDGGHFLDIPEDINLLRDYFVENVSGRGALPTIRVRNQPYGIMTVSGLGALNAGQQSPNPFNGVNLDEPEKSFYKKLFNFLKNGNTNALRKEWNKMANALKTVDELEGTDSQSQGQFMKILGLHARSVAFYNRYGMGRGDEDLQELIGYADPLDTVFKTNFENKFGHLFDLPPYVSDPANGVNNADPLYSDGWNDLVLGQLRMLNQHLLLTGPLVDKYKPKENRKLDGSGPTAKNYIETLLETSPLQLFDLSRMDQEASRSLLFLLLRTALVNEYWNAAMNIYKRIELGDFKTRSLKQIDWDKAESNGYSYTKPPKKPTSLDDLKINWGLIRDRGLTNAELREAHLANSQEAIDNNTRLAGIKNIEFAYSLIHMYEEFDQDNDELFDKANPTTPEVDYMERLSSDARIDKPLSRIWYKNFIKGIDIDGIDNFMWGDQDESLHNFTTYMALRHERRYMFNQGGSPIGIVDPLFLNVSGSDINHFSTFLIPADGRLPFLDFDLHQNELGGTFSGTIKMADYLQQDKWAQQTAGSGGGNTSATLRVKANDDVVYLPSYREETRHLDDLKKSFNKLAEVSTAELERLMAEHIDLCSYRLDAWILGLFNKRLSLLRASKPDGLFIGAYGWVLNLQEGGERKIVSPGGAAVGIATDADNQGYIHAPSLNHALAAAMLRSGYEAKGDNSILEVNLSSRRVRRALYYLEGIRNGQLLSALLGYQFERGLHENNELNVNEFISDFRVLYPLANENSTDTSEISDAVIANNVVDGLLLINAFKSKNNFDQFYPGNLPSFSTVDANTQQAIVDEVERIMDDLDAVSDLAMAEGIYQLVMGNYSRSEAMMNAITEGTHPPEPEVIKTPRTGTMLTHRVGISMKPISALDTLIAPPDWPTNLTAKAAMEPSLNYWLGEQLGNPEHMRCMAQYTDESGAEHDLEITVADLNIQPLDFLLCFAYSPGETDGELAKRLKLAALQQIGTETTITKLQIFLDQLLTTSSTANYNSIGSLMPYFIELLQVVIDSRPCHAMDVLHASEAESAGVESPLVMVDELHARIITAYGYIDSLRKNIASSILKISAIAGFNQDDFEVKQIGGKTIDRGITRQRSLKVFGNPRQKSGYQNILQNLIAIASFDLPLALPDHMSDGTDEEKAAILGKAKLVLQLLASRMEVYNAVYKDTGNFYDLSDSEKLPLLLKSVSVLFGDSFPVVPLFKTHNKDSLHNAAQNNILPADPLAMESWLTGIGRVREKMNRLENVLLLKGVLGIGDNETCPLHALQLPYKASDHWVGLALPENYFDGPGESATEAEQEAFENEPLDKLSIVLSLNDDFETQEEFSMLLLDEWTEVIPEKEETTGIAFHYDQPNAQPPQTLLLALHPDGNSANLKWTWEHISDCLQTTLELAKIRAVEPDSFSAANNTFFAHLFPATMSQVVDNRTVEEMATELNDPNIEATDFEPEYELSTDFMANNGDLLYQPSATAIGSVAGNDGSFFNVSIRPKETPHGTGIQIEPGGGVHIGPGGGVQIGGGNDGKTTIDDKTKIDDKIVIDDKTNIGGGLVKDKEKDVLEPGKLDEKTESKLEDKIKPSGESIEGKGKIKKR